MSATYDSVGLHIGNPGTMRTYSGRKVDPFTMTAADVSQWDIEHALSRQCRFNGHTVGHLSVARHSVWVMQWVQRHISPSLHYRTRIEHFLAALLHDAAEAYIGDMIRPVKHHPEFAHFVDLDHKVTAVILEAFKLPFTELPEIIHEADNAIGLAEVNILRYQWDSSPEADLEEFSKQIKAMTTALATKSRFS